MTPRLPLLCLLGLCLATCSEGEAPPTPSPEPPQHARPAAHAGSWYPASPEVLRREIETRLGGQPPADDATPIIAMLGPHAGLRYSGSVAAAGYAALRGQRVGRVFLLGPSHRTPFQGISLPADDVRGYATPLGELAIDRAAIAALRGQAGFGGPPAAHDLEHSLEMHAIFIAAVEPEATLVPLVVGRLGDRARVRDLASRLRTLLRPGDVVIASSDFTHYGASYGYVPFAEQVPQRLEELMDSALQPLLARDLAGFEAHLSSTGDTICGREPLRLLLALLPGDASGIRVAADTSGRITGAFSNSVSYVTALYRRSGGWAGGSGATLAPGFQQGPEVLDADARRLALQLARKTLESYLASGRVLDDAELGVPETGPLREPYAAFVTLKRKGELRGCIGSLLPVQPLWQDIRDNAIAAAVRDRRFSPVGRDELDRLQLEISVLTHPSAIPTPEAFEVGRHGVILQAFGRRAVFLPQVAPEQGWDRDTTLGYLSRKAGLPVDAWRSPATQLAVFEAQVFAEPGGDRLTERGDGRPTPTRAGVQT